MTVVPFKVVYWRVYTRSPVIMPLFVVFCEVHCLKLSNCASKFCFSCGDILVSWSSRHLWLPSKGILVFFQAYVDGPGTCLCNSSSVRYSAGRAQILATIMHVQVIIQNVLSWSTWSSKHVSNFADGDSPVVGDVFFQSIHIFICIPCQRMSGFFAIFGRDHPAFELWKSLKK